MRLPCAVADRLTAAATAQVPLALIPAGGRDLAATVPGISVWLAGRRQQLATHPHIAAGTAASAAGASGAPGW